MKFVDISEIPKEPKIILYDELYKSINLKKPNIFFDFRYFWENLEVFGSKEYVFFGTTFINHRYITFIHHRMRISCIGGEYENMQKPKMVFVDDVPKKHGGREGFNFEELLAQIPEGKAWKIAEGDSPSIATVREYIKKNKAKEYDAVQRTVDKKKYLYVSAIPKTK